MPLARIPAQVIHMLGSLPDGTSVVNIPSVHEYLTRSETINRVKISGRIIYTWQCERSDQREFVTFSYSQLLNQIVRHKAAHVKMDLKSVRGPAKRAVLVSNQAPRRRSFISVYAPGRRPALP